VLNEVSITDEKDLESIVADIILAVEKTDRSV
jgi:hypothetical protein